MYSSLNVTQNIKKIYTQGHNVIKLIFTVSLKMFLSKTDFLKTEYVLVNTRITCICVATASTCDNAQVVFVTTAFAPSVQMIKE